MLDFGAVALNGGICADALWGLCLALMAWVSVRAWRRMHPQAWAPLQWGRDGRPVMRAQRNLAVGFTPVAACSAGLMLAAGERLGGVAGDGWLALRLAAPVLLLLAHRSHMVSALKTLKVEGGLKR